MVVSVAEFTPSPDAREALVEIGYRAYAEGGDPGDVAQAVIARMLADGWVPRDEFARHVAAETLREAADGWDIAGGRRFQHWLRERAAALSVEAPAETPKLDSLPWLHTHRSDSSCDEVGTRMATNNGVGNEFKPRAELGYSTNREDYS
jgi:hypothetical protein